MATLRERVWEMAKKQFIATHCGVCKLDIKCYNPLIRHFLETVIGSAVHLLIEVKILHFGASFSWLWLPLWVKSQVQYVLLSYFTHGSANVPLLIVIGCVYMELLFLQMHWPE